MKKKIIMSFRKKRNQVIKKSEFLTKHPLLVPVIVFFVLFFSGLSLMIMVGSSTKGASDSRIVNVYVDGEQQTVTTRAKNINELLQRLNVAVDEKDIVEPARDSLILEDDTQVNIYRARPVVISDGDRLLTISTAQRAPRLVVADAGINILPEDDANFERLDTSVLESGVSEQLQITRSVEVQLNIYGAIKLVRTTAKNVNELLQKESINPAENETIEPNGETPITSGMLISVNKPGVKTAVVSEPIPFSSETHEDPDLEAGKSRIGVEGINGERAVVYQIDELDGVEISRSVIQEVVLRVPQNEIKLRGIKIVAPKFNSTQTVSGDKSALMRDAGISESDYGFVDYIITHESHWRPGSANSYSGAYGLCQAYPASKMSSAGSDYLTNPITQLEWCTGYATERYGSWGGAYRAWQAQGWW